MNKILSKEVSVDLAKLLFEKQIVIESLHFYTKPNSKMFGIDEHGRTYSIKNITGKLYTCGEHATLNIKNVYFAPTIADVIDFIFEKYGIFINIWSDTNLNLPEWKDSAKWFYVINCDLLECYDLEKSKPKNIFNTPLEAYEEAIKFILNREI